MSDKAIVSTAACIAIAAACWSTESGLPLFALILVVGMIETKWS